MSYTAQSGASSSAAQLLLFDRPARTRKPAEKLPPSNQTPTSRAAALSMAVQAPKQRGKVFEYVARFADGRTCDEVQAALDMLPQSASARIYELRRLGLIIDSGRTRPTRTGRAAVVYIARKQANE